MECFPRKQTYFKLGKTSKKKKKPGFNRRLSTSIGSKRQLVFSNSWLSGEVQMGSPGGTKGLLAPDLLCAKSKVLPR